MTTTNNNNEITILDYKGIRHGYEALIICVILGAIEDLGHAALQDEGTLDWLALTDVSVDVLSNAIDAMPIKNGAPDARPAMRRIMESLDARKNMVDAAVHFAQVELDNVAEPTEAELIDIDFDAVLENVIWKMDGE